MGEQGSFYGKSGLERAFGIDHPSLLSYMSMTHTDVKSAKAFGLSLAMEHDTNPLVVLAAGWAAAEAGLAPRKVDRPSPSPMYTRAFYQARRCWVNALEKLGEARERTMSFDIDADLFGMQTRTLLALSYLPSMNLAARLMNREIVSQSDREGYLNQTKQEVINLAKSVGMLKGTDNFFLNARRGLSFEMLSGQMLQDELDSEYVFLPSSLRQDNNTISRLRADLIAIPTSFPFEKKLIGVFSKRDTQKDSHGFMIFPDNDLVLEEQGDPYDIVGNYFGFEGAVAIPDADAKLAVVSRSLGNKFHTFLQYQ